MSFHIKSPVPRLIIKDFSPASISKPRVQTPPLHFPIHSKFSNQLLENLQDLKVGKVLSYSTLLTSQGTSPRPPEEQVKKQVTTYKSPSRIAENKIKAISLQKLQFNQDFQKRKKSSVSKPKKFLKIFRNPASLNSNLHLVCQQAKLLKPLKSLKRIN